MIDACIVNQDPLPPHFEDVELFGGIVNAGNPKLEGTDLSENEYLLFNFNDYPNGMVTLFNLLVMGNWQVWMQNFDRNSLDPLILHQLLPHNNFATSQLGAANGRCGRDVGRPIAGPSHPTVDVNRTRPSDAMDL
ncbi:Two pore calcium channel protein 1A [Acorus calamus]|uniref:Two pore calcium channel protein 1A n=1 Tax=Acorus calamus TaxID=4465 RepID=A0AAV9FKM2_ACOCL|nr:Two pore calcium channel protein 1A [Acorus calamus]